MLDAEVVCHQLQRYILLGIYTTECVLFFLFIHSFLYVESKIQGICAVLVFSLYTTGMLFFVKNDNGTPQKRQAIVCYLKHLFVRFFK